MKSKKVYEPETRSREERGEEMGMLFMVFFFPVLLTSQALSFSFNSSILPAFSPNTALPSPSAPSSQTSPSSRSFLKEVFDAIAAKEQWYPETDARVSVVETESARVSAIQSFDFHVRVGRATLILKFSEEAEAWRKAGSGEVEFGPDFVALDEGYRRKIRVLKLVGPLELHAKGGDDVLSVHLPSLNITHQGLKRVLVGQDISIEVDCSGEISFFYPYDIAFLRKESSSRHQFWPLGFSSCAPMLSVRVAGSASLVASRVPNSRASFNTSFPSHNTIELLPEKCYSKEQVQFAASQMFVSKFAIMEKLLNSFLGKSILLNRSSRLLQTKITSSILLKFRVEVERNITENDGSWKKVANWRTRPAVERYWFEIVGKFDGGGRLIPVLVRKLPRPLMIVESAAWSHLMSNLSFTEFPAFVVPPEALTLDIKW